MYSGRKKKFNKYERSIDEDLDLHGFRLKEAQEVFVEFLEEVLETEVRRVRVITGKGLHSENGVGVITEMVIDILKAHKIKHREGKPDEGGDGVVIIDF